MQSESSKGATGRRVLEIDLVRHTIVKNLDNVYSIKDIQGLLSLYALGFLPREDLKDHLTRSVAKALGVPCESEHIRLDEHQPQYSYCKQVDHQHFQFSPSFWVGACETHPYFQQKHLMNA